MLEDVVSRGLKTACPRDVSIQTYLRSIIIIKNKQTGPLSVNRGGCLWNKESGIK